MSKTGSDDLLFVLGVIETTNEAQFSKEPLAIAAGDTVYDAVLKYIGENHSDGDYRFLGVFSMVPGKQPKMLISANLLFQEVQRRGEQAAA